MNHGKNPRQVLAGTPDYQLVIYVFSEGHRGWLGNSIETTYVLPPGHTYEVPSEEKDCPHPSCDAMKDHQLEEDSACPWHSGNCWYCDYSDCAKSHPKCDGLTYDQRNETT